MLSLVEITAFRLESNFPPIRALEFIRDNMTFKLAYDFSYHMNPQPSHIMRDFLKNFIKLDKTLLFSIRFIFKFLTNFCVLKLPCSPRMITEAVMVSMKVRATSKGKNLFAISHNF